MRAIVVDHFGGPEVLAVRELPGPNPEPGEALIRVTYAGVNYIDIYYRSGLYQQPLPFIPGQEGLGFVEAVCGDVGQLHPGDRVAWITQMGSYAELIRVPSARLIPLPAGLEDSVAAATMLQGIAASYLTTRAHVIVAGETVVVHAAAGGLGQLLVQMAKRAGGFVIGTVSTPAKAEIARGAGADQVAIYADLAQEVRRFTGGRGADVVYDSVGQATFESSLTVLRPRGCLVLCGLSSGAVPSFDLERLRQLGSLFLTRTSLKDYVASREELLAHSSMLFRGLEEGWLRVRIQAVVALPQAGYAHRLLEDRLTTGKLLLDTRGTK